MRLLDLAALSAALFDLGIATALATVGNAVVPRQVTDEDPKVLFPGGEEDAQYWSDLCPSYSGKCTGGKSWQQDVALKTTYRSPQSCRKAVYQYS